MDTSESEMDTFESGMDTFESKMDTFKQKNLKMCIFPLLRIPRKNTKHPKNGLKMPKMSLDECIHGCILNQYSLLIYAFFVSLCRKILFA